MYDRLLVATDGSPEADAAARRGLNLALAYGAQVHVLSVVDTRPYVGVLDEADRGDVTVELEMRGEAAIERLEALAEQHGVSTVPTLRTGRPDEEIVDYARDHEIDLVVLGARGTDAEPVGLGGTAERVVKFADVPVLTTHDVDGAGPEGTVEDLDFETIVLPTDGSDAAGRAADHVIDLAGRYGARLHVLYVVDSDIYDYEDAPRSIIGLLRKGGTAVVDELVEQASEADVEATGTVLTGVPYREILDYTDRNDADLVALGTRGKSDLPPRILGSTTDRIVRVATPPVLTVR